MMTGFGLIWDADEQALGLYMAAGIPIIVKKGLSCEKYVIDNEIGAAATDFEKKTCKERRFRR